MSGVIDAIGSGDLKLPLPQTLLLDDGEALHCEKLLRLLPGKRGVFKARYRNQNVLAKIFLDRAERQVAREHAGYARLIAAQQPTPQLIGSIAFQGGMALLYEFLVDAQPLFREDIAPTACELECLLDRLLSMYAAGVYHSDLHWGNFLLQRDTAFVIDAGAILGEPPRALAATDVIDNLGLLIAQFLRCDQEIVRAAVLAHALCTRFELSAARLVKVTEGHWQRRKQILLKKCFRETTTNHFAHASNRIYAYRREYSGADLDAFLRDPDSAMARGKALKLGNSATVVKLELDGRSVVVKRYNIKNALHWLRRCLRPSRAWISWRNAHRLELLGLHTPQPIAFLEMRCGFLRKRAYYICAFVEGDVLANVLNRRDPSPTEMAELEKYFTVAAQEQLIHGDMKATNFLSFDEHLEILDLDAMRTIQNPLRWRKLFRRDFTRFERNVRDASAGWLTSLRNVVEKLTENYS